MSERQRTDLYAGIAGGVEIDRRGADRLYLYTAQRVAPAGVWLMAVPGVRLNRFGDNDVLLGHQVGHDAASRVDLELAVGYGDPYGAVPEGEEVPEIDDADIAVAPDRSPVDPGRERNVTVGAG